jgi:tetratricopeptide (TPR) repeat protein
MVVTRTAAALLLALATAAFADEAQDIFDRLYGDDMKRVLATPTLADDIALARQLVNAARTVAHQPALVAVFCDKAYELGAKDTSGHAVAMEAMNFLAEAAPGEKTAAFQKTAAIFQKQYAAAHGDAKAKAGEALIEALGTTANAQAAAGDVDAATSTLRQAVMIATAVKSDSKTAIQTQLDGLAQRQKLQKQIAALKAALAARPDDAASRKELVRLLLVEEDNPAEAAKFVDESLDEPTRKYVPAAAKPPGVAPKLACRELGAWYKTLADGAATPASKGAMLRHAQGYVTRYLQLHPDEDVARTTARLLLKAVEEALAKLPPAPKVEAWVDLLALADPTLDGFRGAWQRQGTSLVGVGEPGRDSLISMPMVIDGSYELQITMNRTGGNDLIGCILPVGSSSVGFCLGFFSERGSGLFPINGTYPHDPANPACVQPGPLQNNREYAVQFKVTVSKDQGKIEVFIDGKPFVSWAGPQSALSVWPSWQQSPARRISLGCRGSTAVFSVVRLNMLSGEAKPLR